MHDQGDECSPNEANGRPVPGRVCSFQPKLVGNNSKIDSMKLVELCLSLEDRATELDFEFDWASENAMSKSKSIFRTVKSLAEEFQRQKNDQQ